MGVSHPAASPPAGGGHPRSGRGKAPRVDGGGGAGSEAGAGAAVPEGGKQKAGSKCRSASEGRDPFPALSQRHKLHEITS